MFQLSGPFREDCFSFPALIPAIMVNSPRFRPFTGLIYIPTDWKNAMVSAAVAKVNYVFFLLKPRITKLFTTVL